MFDIAFSELLVIGVVALLVIGPEKLPKVARTAGVWMGRFQRYAAQIKEEVNRETRFADLQQLQQEIKQSVENSVESLESEVSALESRLNGDDTPKLSAKPTKARQAKPKIEPDAPNAQAVEKSAKPKATKTTTKKPEANSAEVTKSKSAAKSKPAKSAESKLAAPKQTKSKLAKPAKALTPS